MLVTVYSNTFTNQAFKAFKHSCLVVCRQNQHPGAAGKGRNVVKRRFNAFKRVWGNVF